MTNKKRINEADLPPIGAESGANIARSNYSGDFWDAIKKLLICAKPQAVQVSLAVALTAMAAILNLIGPGLLSQLTNLISQGIHSSIDVEQVTGIVLILVAIYCFAWLFNYVQGLIMAGVVQKVTLKLRRDISEKIDRLALSYFDSTSTGNVMSRISNDVDLIAETLSQSVGTLISASTLAIGSLALMFITNWILATAATLTSILGFAVLFFIVFKSQKYFFSLQESLGKINGTVEETYSGHAVVRAFNAEDTMEEKFDAENDELYESAWKSQFYSGLLQPLMNFVSNLGYVSVCVVGAVLVLNNATSFGTIVAFMVYVRQFTGPLSRLAQVWSVAQSTAAATTRVFEILNEAEMCPDAENSAKLANTKGQVDFKHVSFGYTEEKSIISDFSCNVSPGQKVAIVGTTGSGKTTLANLLLRFYELNGGVILIDGARIEDLPRENLRNQFCTVMQDTWLMEGTIKENVIFSTTGASDEDVINVCKTVGMHQHIQAMSNGYDTVLDSNTTLSAGQKQLLTIARAMLRNAPMLIFDEATSNVDTRTEELIQKSMDKLMAGKTSFIIAHRLSTIKNADLILVLDKGKVVEQGSHQELINKAGVYAELYNSQFEE